MERTWWLNECGKGSKAREGAEGEAKVTGLGDQVNAGVFH